MRGAIVNGETPSRLDTGPPTGTNFAAGAFAPFAPQDLKQRAVRGGTYTFAGQIIGHLIAFGSLAVLARLLYPEDFGLIAMVTVITGLIAIFADAGLSLATIQRSVISHEQVSTLFWCNVALGLMLAVAMCAMAPAIAWFYGDGRLTSIALVLSLGLVIRSLGVQHLALLRRTMRFDRVFWIDVAAAGFAAIVAILLAIRGVGYWALVGQTIASSLASVVLTWRAVKWVPGRPVRGAGVRSMLRLGGALTGSTVLVYLMRNVDNLLIGWYWGASALGFYSRAYILLLLPMRQFSNPIGSVAVPTLSRLQNDPERFRRAYRQGVLIVSSLMLPTTMFLLVAAESFVLTVLGHQWMQSIDIFRALAPAAIVTTCTFAPGWIFISLGRGGAFLQWTAATVPVILLGFCIALPFGPLYVAASLSVTLTLLFPTMVWWSFRGTALRYSDLIKPITRPMAAAAIASAITIPLTLWLKLLVISPLQLVVAAAVFGATYVSVWLLIPGGWQAFRAILPASRVTPTV